MRLLHVNGAQQGYMQRAMQADALTIPWLDPYAYQIPRHFPLIYLSV